jgi:CRISPR-associated protein Csb1
VGDSFEAARDEKEAERRSSAIGSEQREDYMTSELTIDRLVRAVEGDAAIRRVRRLQPAGGPGSLLFPPTYPGSKKEDPPRHVFEQRRLGGQNVLCVLIDSVQSQANRMEEALRDAREAGDARFPVIAVDFEKAGLADLGRITTLEAPHRVFDAIIRDSQHEGKAFRETDAGQRVLASKVTSAQGVYEISPNALLLGAWNSTGEGGGMGAKFPRVVVSEIVGIGVATEPNPVTHVEEPSGRRTGSRIDPLGIRSAVHVYKQPDGEWSLEEPKAAKGKDKLTAKEVRPSEVNHSNIAPTVQRLGVSVDYVQHTFVLSLAGLRRIKLSQQATLAANTQARTCLAALGLLALVSQDRAGYSLRSRCDLVPEAGAPAELEVVLADGTIESVSLDYKTAVALLKAAVEAASKEARWREADVVLEPQAKLVELVRRSREAALLGEDSESED